VTPFRPLPLLDPSSSFPTHNSKNRDKETN